MTLEKNAKNPNDFLEIPLFWKYVIFGEIVPSGYFFCV